MTVHELRQFFMSLSRERSRARLVITLLSFGFKYGLPVDADLVFDARCLPNPHFVPTLRRRTGRDRAVVEFMERDSGTRGLHGTARGVRALRRPVLRRGREELSDDCASAAPAAGIAR
jgi:RNase adaptor protein for sRNA GlmZ degradation